MNDIDPRERKMSSCIDVVSQGAKNPTHDSKATILKLAWIRGCTLILHFEVSMNSRLYDIFTL